MVSYQLLLKSNCLLLEVVVGVFRLTEFPQRPPTTALAVSAGARICVIGAGSEGEAGDSQSQVNLI